MAQKTRLQSCIEDLSAIFNKYASEDGDSKTLSKAEAKKLLLNEMPELLENPNDMDKVSAIAKDLDMDGDGKVDFIEFMTIVMTLGFMCHLMDQGEKL